MRGRGGRCLPFLLKAGRRVSSAAVPDLALYDHDTVLKAITAAEAVELVRDGFVRHATGEWVMPPKVYLDAPPHGDFRAMPARGAGLAILKWATSFPGNPARGLGVVNGVICISDADTGEMRALVNVEAVTALRTGAVAAVAAQELAREDARTVGIVGCGVHGSWAARRPSPARRRGRHALRLHRPRDPGSGGVPRAGRRRGATDVPRHALTTTARRSVRAPPRAARCCRSPSPPRSAAGRRRARRSPAPRGPAEARARSPAGWGARGGRRRLVRAAIGHVLDFETWRSLERV